ncbi:hypothetical protein [Marinoscillum furvescens]|uniref:Uncharacterized protein n=1 Tax=Marinoscillum furvescens DSM 4134 TaxID=1122208 RepID=A0A3D9KWC3_MARFU|nr:hypothetical protein [Marinoscillum furvescens]RED92436.1 hypothetical protein C7460_1304 [Marinoscillum furvescens DSM 4134]
MEGLEASQKIIDLGKSIVKELELDPGADTLSKWMAHYVAEKIEVAKKLTGSKKAKAEKECFEIILKLWEDRFAVPTLKSYLDDFKPFFETLEKLRFFKEKPFFYPPEVHFDIHEECKESENAKAINSLDHALLIDKIARSIISELLSQTVFQINLSEEKLEYLKNAIDLIDYQDRRIITFTSDYKKYLESQADDGANERIDELKIKLSQLEEFDSIKKGLIDKFNGELKELESHN